jgi:hypothetical protein
MGVKMNERTSINAIIQTSPTTISNNRTVFIVSTLQLTSIITCARQSTIQITTTIANLISPRTEVANTATRKYITSIPPKVDTSNPPNAPYALPHTIIRMLQDWFKIIFLTIPPLTLLLKALEFHSRLFTSTEL